MDRVTWDEYFMTLALLTAKRSKDPSTQVGACIVDDENKVVSIGYNGMPRHCDDTKLTWEKGEDLNNKYLYVCHAEFNAILNTRDGSHLNGCRIYVTLFPCNECAKKKVIYLSNKYEDQLSTRASKKLFEVAGVEIEQYKGRFTNVELK